jgi:hypothetical protein
MMHDELMNAAKKAINEVFGDRSVTKAKTREALHELEDDLLVCLHALEEDEDRE